MMFGALEGGSKVRKAKLMAEQLPDSSAAAQELVFRFAFDPRVARHLLARPVAEIGTPTWNRDSTSSWGGRLLVGLQAMKTNEGILNY